MSESTQHPYSETPETLIVTLHESMDAVIGQAVTQLKNTTVTDERLAELKRDYSAATIAGVNDKDGYKFVSEGLSTIKKTVTEIGKIRKELTEPALKFQRNLIAEEKRIVSELEPLIRHLTGEKSKIDAEKERLKKEKELRFLERTNTLFSMGVKFDGFVYSLNGGDMGEIVVPVEIIQDGSAEEFDAKIQEINAFSLKIKEAEQEKQRKAEEAAKAAAEAARIEAEKQAQKDKEIAELKAKLEALEKQNAPEVDLTQNVSTPVNPVSTPPQNVKPNWADQAKPKQTPVNTAVVNTTPVNPPAVQYEDLGAEIDVKSYNAAINDVITLMSTPGLQLNRAGWISEFRKLIKK